MITDDQRENRLERKCICEVENVTLDEIEKIFNAFPQLYGIEEQDVSQHELF